MPGCESSRSILIVEDDIGLRKQLRFSLEQRFETREAGTAAEAVTILRQQDVDVVILDLGLPPAQHCPDEGVRLFGYILENNSSKVIILTGQGTKDIAVEAIRRGVFDYIVKPVDMEKIFFAVDRALLFREAEQEYEASGVRKVVLDAEIGKGLQVLREEAERSIIHKVLRDTDFNVYKSAKLLGVKRESLYYFMKKFGWKRDEEDVLRAR